MNKNNSFVFLKKSRRFQDSNFDILDQTNKLIKIQEKTFLKNFGKKKSEKFGQIFKNLKTSKFQKFGQNKNFFSFLFGKNQVLKQNFIFCMFKKFIQKQSFSLSQNLNNSFFEILETFNLLKNCENLFLKVQFFYQIFQKKVYTIFQQINIQKLLLKFFEKKKSKTLFFQEFFKSSQSSSKIFIENVFSNTILFPPKFIFFIFTFFLELQFSIFSNLKNSKKIQKKFFLQTFSKNLQKSVFRIQFFEKKQNKNLFFHNQTFYKNSKNKTKHSKTNEIKVAQKEKNLNVQKISKKQKFCTKILFFVFSWVFTFINKNFHFSNVPLEKISNFQIQKTKSSKNLEQNYFSKKNLFFMKQKNKQKISFGFFSKLFCESFDLKRNYSKMYVFNSLNLFKKSVQLFDSFLNLSFLNLGEDLNYFQMIFYQYLKFDFFNVQTQLQKNEFWFAPFFTFQMYDQNFFCFSEKKICFFSDLSSFHQIPQNFQKPFGFMSKQNLPIFLQKNFLKTFSFFLNSVQKEKKRKENILSLKNSHFEKSFFHFSQLVDDKKLKQKFLFSFVFLLKRNSLIVQNFSFLSDFGNSLEKPICFLWKKYFSNFLFLNSTLLFFFKKSSVLKKSIAPIDNSLFLKNSLYSIFLKQTEQKKFFRKNFFQFFTKPFLQTIIQTQKKQQNIFYDRNIFWLISKKFLFFPTKIQKLKFFHFSPFFSELFIVYKKSIPFFLSQTPQTKNFFLFLDFFNQKDIKLVSDSEKNQKTPPIFLKEKKLVFVNQKMFKTYFFLKHKKQHKYLYDKKKFFRIFFQNNSCQNLNFDGFSVFLHLKSKKQLQYFYNFEKKPTYENIQNHLNECKQILKKSIGQKQLNFMKKLHKKIQSWSKKYNTRSSQKIFQYSDSMLLKFLWNWARRTHPNKSKGWIRKKYFIFIYSHKWFFGKKIGKIFVCLPFHSQTNFHK
jgi:hypothetical protein